MMGNYLVQFKTNMAGREEAIVHASNHAEAVTKLCQALIEEWDELDKPPKLMWIRCREFNGTILNR